MPWLVALDRTRSVGGALLSGWAMSVAFSAAVFAWFGEAIGRYTDLGPGVGLAVLLVGAPLFQPQFVVFALARHVAGRRHGTALRALVAAAAWVATEWLVPKLLGDTLGHGLHPSRLMRQAADIGGAAGLTLLLLLANEGVAAALTRGRGVGRDRRAASRGDEQSALRRGDRRRLRAVAAPLAAAASIPALLAAYGLVALAALPAASGKPLRVALVQSNLVDYEQMRRERGAAAVVREILDTHAAMSRDAALRQHADAVLWSETVYPTTFAHPKSDAGAELDREVLGIVDAMGVPVVFGTYDRDAAGEYNAAAFVAPGSGLVGFYRKTRVFPLTEHVPSWLDGPTLRRWLPWTGGWQPGDGARVLPLRLADGRDVPVVPLICLDDMDTRLAIDGARLGAQAIVTLSNDAWFRATSPGAALHQAAAAFRSIETRLPQFRVTTNGYSAVIDATGDVVAGSALGERTLVVGALPVGDPPRTRVVAWGDWVGGVGLAFVVVLALFARVADTTNRGFRLGPRFGREAGARSQAGPDSAAPVLPADVAVLPHAARLGAGALRTFARGALLWIVVSVLRGDGVLQANPLAQLRTFALLFVVPEAAAWCVLQAFAARASIEHGALVLAQGPRRLALALLDIAAVEPWRLPIPCRGASLRLVAGGLRPFALAHPDPAALAGAIAGAIAGAGAGAGGASSSQPDATPASAGAPTAAPGAAAPEAGAAAAAAGATSSAIDASPPAAGVPPPAVDAAPWSRYLAARGPARRALLDRPWAKFGLLPLALALPAFRLHQHIAYGGTFGEYYTYGPLAYLATFALWWAAWTMGAVAVAAALRTAIEVGTLATAVFAPDSAIGVRRLLERLGLVALYLGLPGWLLVRVLAG